ncbi:hypothetical protein L486_05230 [Kwoniella mangroviensis CBS 10435]|uniref:Uncharacterized protein n=1 Tax=Kwoniella mangroviensis CBS 10435 TaxID=1331196 RepID=A0A1B9IQC6_9TREE|nr:hypothetical protein L486_05230 [Kwoniella mangroviensis CBS 10435]
MSNPQRTYTNPFYTPPPAASAPPAGRPPTSPPPSYNNSTRPGQSQSQPSAEPVQYGSLSSLGSGRNPPPPPPASSSSSFNYQPDPQRQGYRAQSEYQSSSGSGGRELPPVGRDGMMPPVPPEPPRRNVPTSPATASTTAGASSYLKQAQGYIPERAQNTFGAAADRVNDGWRSVATNERKDQVMSGLGKLGAGAAKLTAKGAYQIGKFASK